MRPLADQRGAVLAIALVLMLGLALLGGAASGMARLELLMTSGEQSRQRAQEAAEAAIEVSLAQLREVPPIEGAPPVLRSGEHPSAPVGADSASYQAATDFRGVERGLPQSSIDRYVGLHYRIRSRATAARGAMARLEQGALVVAGAGSAAEYRRLHEGLAAAVESP